MFIGYFQDYIKQSYRKQTFNIEGTRWVIRVSRSWKTS